MQYKENNFKTGTSSHTSFALLFTFFSPKLSSKLVKVPSHAVAEWLVPLSLEDLCKSFSPGASALQRLNK